LVEDDETFATLEALPFEDIQSHTFDAGVGDTPQQEPWALLHAMYKTYRVYVALYHYRQTNRQLSL
jgi:hypothetical protein